METMTREEVVSMLKRHSTGFSRGRCRYRGVTSETRHLLISANAYSAHMQAPPIVHMRLSSAQAFGYSIVEDVSQLDRSASSR